jgi:E3 ubiquitin-protein ligase UBR7
LNDPSSQPQECNQENKYGPNYSGKFCRCGRDYDPETETEAMLNCIACEDWFHESCLNLRPAIPASDPNLIAETKATQPYTDDAAKSEAKLDPEKINEDDEDDEEVLIKSDTYDGLICAACVSSHGYLRSQAGRTGWMVIEPKDGGWEVLGRADGQAPLLSSSAADVKDTNGTDRSAGTDSAPISVKAGANAKRSIEEVSPSEAESPALPVDKKAKKEDHPTESLPPLVLRGKGDVFLADGVRERLKATLPVSPPMNSPHPSQLADTT